MALKASISRSLSTINLTVTLCTRPALSDGPTFLHKTGESSNPTILSNILLACCAFTKSMSIVLGFSIAARIAFLVISENTMRFVLLSSISIASNKCQEIASPSRSSSVANQTNLLSLIASFANFVSSLTTFSESG